MGVRSVQIERAVAFRALHAKRPFVLPNAWDAASARVIELAGARALGTTSGGVSWTLGRCDGEGLGRDEMVAMVRRIAEAVEIPVSADIEGGYGAGGPHDVAETVRAVVEAGVVGINLEDAPGRNGTVLLSAEEHAERLRAAREAALDAGINLLINARTDVYLRQVGAPDGRLEEVLRRAIKYREAGADCVFVPGVIDGPTIGALAEAIGGPLNVMALPGAPTIQELGRLGVARVSIGTAIAQATLATTRSAVRELLEQGTYAALESGIPFAEVDGMFAARG